MDESIGIVLDDTRRLADVCGSNDYNLAVMEKLLGRRVFTRGNELLLEASDDGTRRLFQGLVDGLIQSLEDGLPATPDLIIALHAGSRYFILLYQWNNCQK